MFYQQGTEPFKFKLTSKSKFYLTSYHSIYSSRF